MYDELSSAKVALERIVQSQASVGEKWQTSKNMFKSWWHTYCLCLAVMHSPKESFRSLKQNGKLKWTGPLQRLLRRNYKSLWILCAFVAPFMTLWLKNRNCLMLQQANIHGSRKLPRALVFQLSFPTSDSELKNIKEHYFLYLYCNLYNHWQRETCSNCLTMFVQLFCFDYL